MNDAITTLEETVVSVEGALSSVESLAAEGETAIFGMEEALQKVNQFDIETLNSAIKDLSDVVEPMANFFNVFNKSWLNNRCKLLQVFIYIFGNECGKHLFFLQEYVFQIVEGFVLFVHSHKLFIGTFAF